VNRGASQTGYIIFALTCAGELSSLLELCVEEGLDSKVAYWYDPSSKLSGLYDKFVVRIQFLNV